MIKDSNCLFNWSIVGHQNIVRYLQNNLSNNRISHAYLFVGPSNVGKTSLAKDLAQSLVCRNLAKKNESAVPCGECDNCRQVKNGIHPDIYWLSRELNEQDKIKKNISIAQIRELQGRLSLHSFLDSYKVAIIEEAETLSQEAANALLKTLEEPTAKTVIILLAKNLINLPSTIVSRCQVLKFKPVSHKEIFNHLLTLKIEKKKAKVLAELSFGRVGLALTYATEPDLYLEFLEEVKRFLILMRNPDIVTRFKIADELIKENNADSLKEKLNIWVKVIRDLILINAANPNLISHVALLADLEKIGQTYDLEKLINLLSEIDLTQKYIEANVNPKLALENLTLSF